MPAATATSADHRVGVRLRKHGARQLAGAATDRAEQWPLRIITQLRAVEICDQVFFEVVVAGHRVPLAAFLAQPHPQPAVLRVGIFDRHAERRADPGEGVDHEGDQRAVAQARVRRDIDAVEQRACFRRIEHRRLPRRNDVARPAHGVRRVDRHDLAGDQPVEQVPSAASRCLTEGADSSRVPASIHAATCTGSTAAIDDSPTLPHQAKNSWAARQ